MCHDDKELGLKLMKTPMVGVAKLNLVSMDQMTNKLIVVMFNWSNSNKLMGRLGKMCFPKPHLWVVGDYKEVLANRLLKTITAKE
jgi:hypothetical protein